LHDWLNRKVLSVDLIGPHLDCGLVYQHHEFIDNDDGWCDLQDGSVSWTIGLEANEFNRFLIESRQWLDLELSLLAKTQFTGHWVVG
jgi:hypothetical protein